MHRPLGAVDHHRDAGDLRLGRDVVEKRRHGLLGIEHALVHVDVDEVRAVADLLGRHLHRRGEIVVLDEARELRRPGDVGPLTDHLEIAVRADGERFEAGELGVVLGARGSGFGARGSLFAVRSSRLAARGYADRLDPRTRRQRPRRQPLDLTHNRLDVIRRRPAAAADDVDEAAGDERLEESARLVGLLVVLSERVRQPGVRVAEHVTLGEPRELFEVRAHLARAERAIHADGQRPGVMNRGIERVDHLARQRAAAEIGDRHRDEDRQPRALFLEHVLDRDDAGLGVERVEDRLEQEEVGAAIDEATHLILVCGPGFVEGHPAERWIVDLG